MRDLRIWWYDFRTWLLGEVVMYPEEFREKCIRCKDPIPDIDEDDFVPRHSLLCNPCLKERTEGAIDLDALERPSDSGTNPFSDTSGGLGTMKNKCGFCSAIILDDDPMMAVKNGVSLPVCEYCLRGEKYVEK